MECPKCYREIPSDALLCCYCGKRLRPDPKKATRRAKRPNGTGSVYQRGKTWTCRVVDHYINAPQTKAGLRPKWKTKGGFKTKRDALNYLPTLIQQTPGGEKKAPTLDHYWKTYEKSNLPKLSDSKQTAYRLARKRLESICHYPVDKIGVTMLRETVESVANSYYTARDCKVLLSHLYKLIGADGWASKDLPTYIVLPKLVEKERQTFTEDEQKALWKLYESGDLDAALPLVMICTGMMPGEMMELKTEHINLDKQMVVGVGLKTEVRRKSPVYLPDDIVPVISDLMAEAQPDGMIFYPNRNGWYKRYYAALEKAGCRRLEPYCCRHTTATRLAITEGIAPQTIQRAMRWSTSRMLDRYAHPDGVDIAAAVNTIKRVE